MHYVTHHHTAILLSCQECVKKGEASILLELNSELNCEAQFIQVVQKGSHVHLFNCMECVILMSLPNPGCQFGLNSQIFKHFHINVCSTGDTGEPMALRPFAGSILLCTRSM